MVHGMFNQLSLRPVWEPDKVHALSEGGVLSTSALEVLPPVAGYEAHTEVVPHSSADRNILKF